ncbi:MAG: hypothetical protein Q8K85_14715, partial [Hyphomicrobium sp.]|nr:hypothetical protein [Hyphomicrobium sp.]
MRAFVIATFAAAASLAVPANAATITSYKVAGWKAYTNNGRGWRLDDANRAGPQVGLASLQKILDLGIPR